MRSGLNAARISVANRPGSSQAAKWPPSLYDARRGVYYAKPVLRGRLHLLCFGASLVFGPLPHERTVVMGSRIEL